MRSWLRGLSSSLGISLVVGILLLFLVIPMLSLLWVGFSGEPTNLLRYLLQGDLSGLLGRLRDEATLAYYWEFWATPRYYKGLVNSLIFSTQVTLGCCVLGVGLALILARTAVPLKGTLRLLALIPLALPSYLLALSFILLFGKSGACTLLVQHLTGIEQVLEPMSPLGCALVQILSFFPLVLLTTSAALERMDPSLEEASAMLGGNRSLTFWRVSLPMLLPGVAAGAFLTFIRSFGDFATLMLLIPSNIRMIVVEAYKDMSGNTYWGGAATMSTVMVGVIVLLLAVQKYVIERNRFETLTGKGVATPRLVTHPTVCRALFVLAAIPLGFGLLNLLVIVLLSFAASWGTSMLPEALTLEHYQTAILRKPQALINSLTLSAMALVCALALGGAVAYINHRTRFRGRQVLDFVTLFPFIVPGTAFATALITVFNEPPLALHLTVTLVVIAYFITRAPYAVRSIMASLQQIGPAMEESSATLGATPAVTLFKVLLPMVRPGILAGGIMIFISCMTDVALTIMICPPTWYPASLGIFNSIADSSYFGAAASGVVLMILIFIPYAIMLRVVGVRDMSL